jgi:hypothetical protein
VRSHDLILDDRVTLDSWSSSQFCCGRCAIYTCGSDGRGMVGDRLDGPVNDKT